jgi:hypothetical protein
VKETPRFEGAGQGGTKNSPPHTALDPNRQHRSTLLDLATIERLTDGRIGNFDVACPICGPERHSPVNRRRRVLRIWRIDPAFATFNCARCGEHGHVRDDRVANIDPAAVARARAEAAEHDRNSAVERLSKAAWLWSRSRPTEDTPVEIYLRERRGYSGTIPETIRHLPARGDHGPAMIAAFGMASEPEPGRVVIRKDLLRGVHITRLLPDGTGKAGTDADKVMVGRSQGWPVVVAPPNDLLGLAICEGIEDALSVHFCTGLGAWVSAAASRLPALADAVPPYVEAVTIFAHADPVGRKGAFELAQTLHERGGVEVFVEGLK